MGGIARVPAEVVHLVRPLARLRLALRDEGLTDAEGAALLGAEANRMIMMPLGSSMASATPPVVARYWRPDDAIPVPTWLQDE